MAFHKAKALQEAEKSVGQGKIAQAIKLYQEILDNDPSDVSLLNTIGDLYIRDRNVAEGLKQFHKLAEAYVRDGFNVKAIAIYRKITKVDPNTVDTLLKLAELYQLQGLSREAREQYLQASEFFKKRNQADRALEVFRKVVQLDPENLNYRNRLAAECEQAGKRDDAAQAYLESAEILLRRDDQAGAEAALKKAAEMNPKNSKIQMMRARVAIARQQPQEAENIISSLPELLSDPEGKRILLDCYLAARKIPEAEKLVMEVFHSNPTDFAPVSNVSALLVENGQIEEAYNLIATVGGPLINQNNAGPLLEPLRRIWLAAPKHIPTMELLHQVCERTADELTLPEVLEALGRVHEEAGDLEKAEVAFLKLTEREPENENFHGLLNSVERKLGRERKPVEISVKEMPLQLEEEAPPAPPTVDANQEAMVKEALENSDLFSRYNLTEKAIAELEKVLQVYPDQVEIHRRILEISRKGFPDRAAAAAAQLARIVTGHGDHETASKYEAIASAKGALHEIPLPPPPPAKKVEVPPAPAPAPPVKPEAVPPMEFSLATLPTQEPEIVATPAPPAETFTFDLTPPEAPAEAPPQAPPPVLPGQMIELDLSGDLDAMGSMSFETPAPPVPQQQARPAVEIPAPIEIPVPLEIPMPLEILAPLEIPVIAGEPAPPPLVEEAAPFIEAPAEIIEPPIEPVEEVKVEQAIGEEVKVEVQIVEQPVVEEAKVEVPMVEQAVVEEAKVEVPIVEQAVVEEATVQEPVVEQVIVEEAKVQEPIVEQAIVEEAKVQEPIVEQAIVEEAKLEEPKAEELKVELANVEEAKVEEPKAEETMVEEAIPVDLEDSRIEVEFYLENGFLDEARRTMAALEEKYPRSLFVAELRRQVDERLGEAPPAEPPVQVAQVEEVISAEPPPEFEIPDEARIAESPEDVVTAEPEVKSPEEVAASEPEVKIPEEVLRVETKVEILPESAHEEWELPTSYAATSQPEPPGEPPVAVSNTEIEAEPQVANISPPPALDPMMEKLDAAGAGGMDLLGDMAGDFASSLEGIEAFEEPPITAPAASPRASATPAGAGQGASQLSGLLAEMEEPGGDAAAAAKDDPETHYNLGVAFREMGLLDEAIGEFQKVVKGGGKGSFPQNFLQACSLLAICFMEKKMPAIAAKWYLRALEMPGLDEEAMLALQYDLGVAYEQSGDSRNALERFTEVYSQNIDFRDVAEKIRELQQKA